MIILARYDARQLFQRNAESRMLPTASAAYSPAAPQELAISASAGDQ